MIFNLLIASVSTVFAFLSAFMPEADGFSTTVNSSLESVGNYFFYFDQLISIDTLFFCIGTVVALEIILAGINLARWIIRSIPFMNSRV